MADKIKAFFQKKTKDKKFKNAGKGYSLTESKSNETSSSKPQKEVPRKEPSRESKAAAQAAAQAALSRLEGNKPPSKDFNVSQLAIQKQARRELENQLKREEQSSESSNSGSPSRLQENELAIQGVYFRCPIISDEVLPRKEWLPRIREFIKSQLSSDDEGLAACLIIRNCNLGEERINKCIDILCKYLENIVNHPEEQKYWKIRMSNKVFQEKVKTMDGTLDLLEAAGFRKQQLEHEGNEEDFLVWDPEFSSMENVVMLAEAIRHTEVFDLELDRNMHVYLPHQRMKSELPPEFFTLSVSEVAQEQHSRADELERSQMLATKAYREKMKHSSTRIYKYSLIRIRFPDGVILQGTFAVNEPFHNVFEFLNENLSCPEIPYTLVSPTGAKLGQDDLDTTLNELQLVPAVVLKFSYNLEDGVPLPSQYLKQDTMLYVQDL